MSANLIWNIEVTDHGQTTGPVIKTTGWDVLSKLAAVRNAIPATWNAEAYPEVSTWCEPHA